MTTVAQTESKKQIRVTVESEPHAENIKNVLLNRPAPNGGSFLIGARIERPIWDKMKAAGAHHLSADDLEDFDMFGSEPGWRYGIAALRVLLASGYNLLVRGETVTNAEQLDAMFTEEAKAAYRAKRAAERKAAEQAKLDEKARKQAEADAKGAEYMAWKAERLTGLVETFAVGAANWEKVAFFDRDTPGTWYTTGDAWYQAEVEGQTVYKRSYGNAEIAYAPQAVVDQWISGKWNWYVNDLHGGNETIAAQHVLVDSTQDYIGSDIAKRLIEIRGAQYFVDLATQTEWRVFGKDILDWAGKAARHYGVDVVYLTGINVGIEQYTTGEFLLSTGKQVQSYWRHPNGQIIAKGYYDRETEVVTVEQLPAVIQKYF